MPSSARSRCASRLRLDERAVPRSTPSRLPDRVTREISIIWLTSPYTTPVYSTGRQDHHPTTNRGLPPERIRHDPRHPILNTPRQRGVESWKGEEPGDHSLSARRWKRASCDFVNCTPSCHRGYRHPSTTIFRTTIGVQRMGMLPEDGNVVRYVKPSLHDEFHLPPRFRIETANRQSTGWNALALRLGTSYRK